MSLPHSLHTLCTCTTFISTQPNTNKIEHFVSIFFTSGRSKNPEPKYTKMHLWRNHVHLQTETRILYNVVLKMVRKEPRLFYTYKLERRMQKHVWGQCHKIFACRFFYWIIFPPALDYPTFFLTFAKIFVGQVFNLRCTVSSSLLLSLLISGVADTGGQFFYRRPRWHRWKNCRWCYGAINVNLKTKSKISWNCPFKRRMRWRRRNPVCRIILYAAALLFT